MKAKFIIAIIGVSALLFSCENDKTYCWTFTITTTITSTTSSEVEPTIIIHERNECNLTEKQADNRVITYTTTTNTATSVITTTAEKRKM